MQVNSMGKVVLPVTELTELKSEFWKALGNQDDPLLVCPETVSRVFSVERQNPAIWKEVLFEQNEEVCWNSEQGHSQWVILGFPQHVHESQLQIQSQGSSPVMGAT